MKEVRIEPKDGAKGRTFLATCLASVEADSLWEGGNNSEDERPVWAMFAGSDQELRAFMANVHLGRKILLDRGSGYRKKSDRMEFMKSVGYFTTWQREAEGSVATIFMPDLFRLDPGMVDPDGARFVILPPAQWAAEQVLDVETVARHALSVSGLVDTEEQLEQLRRLVPLSFLFSAYLDRRTRCPLVSDGRFYLQIMLASLAHGLASCSTSERQQRNMFGMHSNFRFTETDTAQVGLEPGIVFQASHEAIETLLSEQVELFFSATKKRVKRG